MESGYKNNKKPTLNKGNCLMILIVAPVSLLLIIIVTPEILSPYSDTCYVLASNVDGLNLVDCVQYMEANPGATGQDVVDAKISYERSLTKIDELLNNPIEP